MKNRTARLLLLSGLVALVGCSSYRAVPRADLGPDRSYENVRVATLDGFEYRFDRVAIQADTLVGFYSITEERSNAKSEVWYEDVLRRHSIPLARVASVQLVRRDPVKTAFYGASLAAAGYLLGTLVEEKRGEPSSGGGGGKGTLHP
jgi:hypothetical protein